MKTGKIVGMVVGMGIVSALLIGVVGCKKEQVEQTKEDVKAGTEKAVEATKEVAADVKEGAEKAATEVKEGAEKVAAEVKDKTTGVTVPAASTSAADTIIAKAKGLVNEGNYQAAMDELASLKGMTLTEAQQKLVNDLETQIKDGLSKAASGAVGNMLK